MLKKMSYVRVKSDFSWLNKLVTCVLPRTSTRLSPPRITAGSSSTQSDLDDIQNNKQNALELINEDPIIVGSFIQLCFKFQRDHLTWHGMSIDFAWDCFSFMVDLSFDLIWAKPARITKRSKWKNIMIRQMATWYLCSKSKQNVQSNQTDWLHLICWYSKTRLDCC